jgi:DNA replication licensing factor MCM7
LRFASVIQRSDVDEALRLIESSKSSLDINTEKKRMDPVSAIYEIIREMSTKANGQMDKEVSLTDVRESVINKGFSEEDLERCVTTYANDDVWMRVGNDGSRLRWISIDDSDDDI